MLTIFNVGEKNIFVTLLELLHVGHTNKFSNRYFNEHPHKYNLFGISGMLSDYKVENVGTRIVNKEEGLDKIQVPFIAHTGSNFVIVIKTEKNVINYMLNGKKMSLPFKQFLDMWTGYVLLVESTKYSIEPGYRENKKIELFDIIRKGLLCFLIIMLGFLVFSSHPSLYNIGTIISIVINVLGVFTTYLLVLNQIHFYSGYSEKICSLFKHSDCNNILESKAAKLFGIIGWSEVGLCYFSSNLLLLFIFPELISYLVVMNVFTLPYAVWSIWYQKVKAKQWCTLCLITQLLLWLIFVNNLIFGLIQMPIFSFDKTLWIVCIYMIPFLGLSLYIPKISERNNMDSLSQEMNSIKSNDKVFNALLKDQPMYPVGKLYSKILFGNPTGIVITILTNPHCNPCSKMHARIEKLLEESPGKFCIQYIFSSFNEDFNRSNMYLIAAYLNNSELEARDIYNEWFKSGRSNRNYFFKKYDYDIRNENVISEFNLHAQWINETKLRATPTILINGYRLPDNYKIEDLKYFSKLDIDVN